jgi:hypothetical protein
MISTTPVHRTPSKRRRWPWIAVLATAVIAVGLVVATILGAFTATPEQSYLQAVRADTGVAVFPDAELLDLGHSSCSAIAGDSDPQAFYKRTQDMELTDSDRGTISTAAIRAFCPQYSFILHKP